MAMEVSPWLVVYVAVIYIYVLVNFLMAGIKDPGIYAKRKKILSCANVVNYPFHNLTFVSVPIYSTM